MNTTSTENQNSDRRAASPNLRRYTNPVGIQICTEQHHTLVANGYVTGELDTNIKPLQTITNNKSRTDRRK
jgi:hypothetical protein